MTCTPELTLGLSPTGKVVLGIACGCGRVALEVELTPQDAHRLVGELNGMIAVAARVQSLPVPWVHEPGAA